MVRPYRDKLSGKVEVDETYVGGEKPGKRGRGALGKSLVMITAEIDGNRIVEFDFDMCRMLLLKAWRKLLQQAAVPGRMVCTMVGKATAD